MILICSWVYLTCHAVVKSLSCRIRRGYELNGCHKLSLLGPFHFTVLPSIPSIRHRWDVKSSKVTDTNKSKRYLNVEGSSFEEIEFVCLRWQARQRHDSFIFSLTKLPYTPMFACRAQDQDLNRLDAPNKRLFL